MREKELLSNKIRLDSYKILSDCYYPPDESLIRGLTHSEGLIGRLFLELVRIASRRDELESLRVDYSRLFVGPFKLLAPPYGSLYLENRGTVMGDSTVEVKERYRDEGIKLTHKEIPDHIAIELEFMYFLIFKENEAGSTADSKTRDTYVKKELSFLRTHLSVWVGEFAEAIEKNAHTDFYKELARVTKAFVEGDLKILLTEQKIGIK